MALEERIEDWPMFGRNPQHTAHYPGDINPDKLKLKWKKEIPGGIDFNSTLIAKNNNLYCRSQNGEIYTFDSETGRQLNSNENIRFLSTIVCSVMYDISDDGKRLQALDSGRELWGIKLKEEIYKPVAYQNGRVILSCRDDVYSLNAKTGKKRWEKKMGGSLNSAPVIFDDKIIITTNYGATHALNIKEGEILWNFIPKDEYGNVRGYYWAITPAVNNKEVYVGSLDVGMWSHSMNYYLHALDAETGKERWVFKTTGYCGLNQPIITPDLVLFGSNNLYILDKKGRKIREFEIGGDICSLIIANKEIYVGTSGGLYRGLCVFNEAS